MKLYTALALALLASLLLPLAEGPVAVPGASWVLIDRLAVIAWLLLPVPLRAVPLQPAGPVAVPGTADVQPAGAAGWYLLIPPTNPVTAEEPQRHPWPPNPLTAPLSQWIKWGTFTSEQACRAAAKGPVGHDYPMLVEPGGPLFFIISGNSHYVLVAEKNIRCVAADDPRLKQAQPLSRCLFGICWQRPEPSAPSAALPTARAATCAHH
jgi:hypothetical protein